jgi:histidyl-tRNA synthetase
MMAADTLERVGIPRGDYVIKVNNRKVLDGVMEAIGLGGDDKAGQRLTVLRAIDKLDRLGREGVRQLLGPGRKDESGDFTKGAGLVGEQIDRLIWITLDTVKRVTRADEFEQPLRDNLLNAASLENKVDNFALLEDWEEHEGSNPLVREGIDELRQLASFTKAAGFGTRRIRIDPSVVRGLEYYTGPVYEAELTFTVTNDEGQPVRFGSVGGGGRYDGLIGRFRSEPVPATGFSIGVSRLLAALQAVKSPIVTGAEAPGPVVVLVMDRERIADYQRMVATLRSGGVRAELYLGASGMKAQMKYADRRKSPCVVIQGSDERERGEVQIKDLARGAALAGGGKDRADYLDKQAEAQFSISESDLLNAVSKVLGRHQK